MKNRFFMLVLCLGAASSVAQADVLSRMKRGMQTAADQVRRTVNKVGGHAEDTLKKLSDIEKKALYDLAEAARRGYEKAKHNFVRANKAVKAKARQQLEATRNIFEIALKNLREVNPAAANRLYKGFR